MKELSEITNNSLYFKSQKGINYQLPANEDKQQRLSLNQIRLLNYSLMFIKPEDGNYSFYLDWKDYCRFHGLNTDGGKTIKELQENINFFHTTPTKHIIFDEQKDEYVRVSTIWFPVIKEHGITSKGKVKGCLIYLNKEVATALANDPYQMGLTYMYCSRLQSIYGVYAWEYFYLNEIYDQPITLTIEEIASIFWARDYLGPNYKWSNFKAKIVDTLVNDINENSLDMVITYKINKEYNPNTGGTQVVSVTFVVHRILSPINIHEYSDEDMLDYEKLNYLKEKYNFDNLCIAVNDKEKAEVAIRVICAAIQALESNNSSIAEKFCMTINDMLEELYSLSVENISQGINEAYREKKRIRHIEVYLLQCILRARTNKDPYFANSEVPDIVYNAPSVDVSMPYIKQTNAHNRYANPEYDKNTQERKKEPKFSRASKETIAKARKKIEDLANPQLLKHTLTCNNIITEEQKQQLDLATEEFYKAMTFIFSTTTALYNLGKPTGTLFTSLIREEIEKKLCVNTARVTIERFHQNTENMKYIDSEAARRNYIIRTFWNYIKEPVTEEDDE